MLNFETDDETDADSIFSRQTSRDDCLDFDDEDEADAFDGVGGGRNEGGGGNKGVARGMWDLGLRGGVLPNILVFFIFLVSSRVNWSQRFSRSPPYHPRNSEVHVSSI